MALVSSSIKLILRFLFLISLIIDHAWLVKEVVVSLCMEVIDIEASAFREKMSKTCFREKTDKITC
jgi:hypothetical protein